MRQPRALVSIAALAVLCLAMSEAPAQVYAAEDEPGAIIRYEGVADTVVNPTDPIPGARGVSLDEFGRLLIAACCGQADVMRFDVEAQTLEYLDAHVYHYATEDIYTDPADASIYVIKNGNVNEDGTRCDSFLGVLPGGMGPPDTVYVFGEDETLVDLQVWPMWERAGNILVLAKDGYPGPGFLAEFEKVGPGSYARLADVVAPASMVPDPAGFAVTPWGGIVIVDHGSGLYRVIEGGDGSLVPFGEAAGPGYADIEIGSDGTIYLVNDRESVVERYDEYGARISPDLSGGISTPTAVTAASFAPTPEGEYAFTEPIDGVEITYEEVTNAGFTAAVPESSDSRVSPGGNFLPDCAAPPGSRVEHFNYISLTTQAVYRNLIQVDVFEEGSRLFYASGIGDTFRDFTVVGSIDDARGTMPRFSEFTPAGGRFQDVGPTEVVLVEDTRTDPQVTLYKFWRLELAMETLALVDVTPCPWQVIAWLERCADSARLYYDQGNIANAITELSLLNAQLRSSAGWCIPDSSDDPLGNIVGRILAHSKTLMFSLENEMGESFTGIDGGAAAVSLAVVSPSDGECRMELSGPVGVEVTLLVYSAAGRLVDTVYEGRIGDAPVIVTWGGTDSMGRRVASGVYFVRAESAGDEVTSKLVYIR